MLYREMGKTGEKVSILGYGCMRFPQKNGRIDEDRASKQIIMAMEKGVNYFDTAYPYHNGKSESFLGQVLSQGYRDKVKIATKLPLYMTHSRKDMDHLLESQLRKLKTDRIDYYLLHAVQDLAGWQRLKNLGILDFLEKSQKEGKIIYRGFSYHGNREDFKKIVDDYPWDFCQIQYNYLDENNQAGKEGLQYAAQKALGVVIMEPLRGGNLAGKMPKEIQAVWDKAKERRSSAEWGLRWVWNHPEVTTVLSGMTEEYQIEENIKIAQVAYPESLTPEELDSVNQVKDLFAKLMKIGCTGCGYCLPCPAGVNIPFCFSLYNNRYLFNNNHAKFQYTIFNGGVNGGKPSYASLCKSCGKCLKACPQHLNIPQHLQEVKREMEGLTMKPLLWLVKQACRIGSHFRNGNVRRES